MFIIAWLVMLLLQANHLVIPRIVELIVGIGAILETCLYVFVFIFAILGAFAIKRKY